MNKLLRDHAAELTHLLNSKQKHLLYKWINKSVGTVHTFQGKQADMVIILLGGNPNKLGAINWASRYPNLLNVALTRAKNLVFVIGNHRLWSSKPYFNVLNNMLSHTSDLTDIFNSSYKAQPDKPDFSKHPKESKNQLELI